MRTPRVNHLTQLEQQISEGLGLLTTERSIRRFFKRHGISFKKTLRAVEQDRPDVAQARQNTHQVETLRRLRHGGAQVIRIERVDVNDGGQAIIGNVRAGSKGESE
jgi:hypothetical protein